MYYAIDVQYKSYNYVIRECLAIALVSSRNFLGCIQNYDLARVDNIDRLLELNDRI